MPDLHELLHTATDDVVPSFEPADVRRRFTGRRRRRRALVASAMVAVVVALAGTTAVARGGGHDGATVVAASPGAEPVAMAGQWMVTSFSGRPDIADWSSGGRSPDAESGPLVTITLWSDGPLEIENCNSTSGSWHQDGDRLTMSPKYSTTVGCIDGTGEAAPGVDAFLFGPVTVAATPDGGVQLEGSGETMTLTPYGFGHVEKLSPDGIRDQALTDLLPAVGTWTLSPIETSTVDTGPVPLGERASLTFGPGGALSNIQVACQPYQGSWTVEAGSLSLDLIPTGDMPSCSPTAFVATEEDRVAFLSRPLSYAVVDDRTIRVTDGDRWMTMSAAPR